MLKTKDAIATLAVKDLKAAAVFYEGALGFEKVAVVDEELIIYRSGNGVFSLYRSKYAGTNKATAISWEVGEDLEAIVTALKQQLGVADAPVITQPEVQAQKVLHGEPSGE